MNTTYEEILNYLCSKITLVATTVGAFSYNILAAVTFRLLDIENKIEAVSLNMDSDTADSDGLDVLAKNKGLTRKDATVGVAKGKFNMAVPSGSRFQIGEIVWVSGDAIASTDTYFYHKMTSEQTGTKVNSAIGTLTPITFISGLNLAEIVEMITLAQDNETDDELRERINDSSSIKSFSGNKASWRELFSTISGVGGCRIYPTTPSAGNTKITFITSEHTPPSASKIAEVQNIVDPDKNGDGEGYTPIDSVTTVYGVTYTNIIVGVQATYSSGTFADWKTEMTNLINEYFSSVNKTWENGGTLIIRQAEIIAKLITSEHITDVTQITLNGTNANLTLGSDNIANLSDVTEIA